MLSIFRQIVQDIGMHTKLGGSDRISAMAKFLQSITQSIRCLQKKLR